MNFNLVISFLFLWVLILTGLFIYFLIIWRKIFHGSSGKILKETLEQSFKQTHKIKNRLNELKEKVDILNSEKITYFQKSAFKRFNPFGDTGGDQSFIWACLDKDDSGIVLSSLHGREGTRVYAKKIEAGVASGHKLSKEEDEVLNLAKTGNCLKINLSKLPEIKKSRKN